MYFEHGIVTISLDGTYTRYPETAQQRVEELMKGHTIQWKFFTPSVFTASVLPDLPVDWKVMACPRAISEDTSRIGLGHLGPKVRAVVKNAAFPIFIPSMGYKPWTSIAAFFGGSDVGLRAAQQALLLADRTGLPLKLYTQVDGATRDRCERKVADAGLEAALRKANRQWVFFESGSLEENLYGVDPFSLAVVGGAGESIVRELMFGSKLETIQNTLPNPILVVGPNCRSLLCAPV